MPRITTDLFHQLTYKSQDGYYAITDYTDSIARTKVYTPHGEWCGGTSLDGLGRMAAVKGIIKYRINFEDYE